MTHTTKLAGAARRKSVPVAALVALLLLVGLALPQAHARGLALLVGVGNYPDPSLSDLEGPPNDVRSLSEVLTQTWGFAPEAVRTLVDRQATRGAILSGIDALHAESRPGDLVVFYFSGHGTSPHDPNAEGIPLPHGTGALMAWDSRFTNDPRATLASLLVGRRDLRPRLERLERDGRDVVVVLDACYSAHTTRGIYRSVIGQGAGELPARYAAPPHLPRLQLGAYGSGRRPPPPPYPYSRVLTLTAANAGELARDIPAWKLPLMPTLDNRPHGAFTDVLLRILTQDLPADTNGDGAITYLELHEGIRRELLARGLDQRPQIFPTVTADPHRMVSRALFDGSAGGPSVVDASRVPDLGVRLAPGAEGLAEALRRLPGVSLESAAPGLVVAPFGRAWLITNPGGDKIAAAADREAVIERVRQRAWLHRLTWRRAKNPFGLALASASLAQGGMYRLGEPVQLEVLPERESWLVLLYVDSRGAVAPLYPAHPREARPLRTGQRVTLPADDSLVVAEPLGTDTVIALAYPKMPGFLDALVAHLSPMDGPRPLPEDSPLFRAILESLGDERGVSIATLDIETVPAH